MQSFGIASLWLALAAVGLGGCVRAGADPPAPPQDATPPADQAKNKDATEDATRDAAKDGPPDGATNPPFNPAGNVCTKADSGPFVELARFKTPNTAYGVWYVAPHLLSASTGAGLYVLGFDGKAFTQRDRAQNVGWAEAIWSQGSTVYLSSPGDGLRAYDLAHAGTLTLLAKAPGAFVEARRLWGDGQQLYVPCGGAGLRALRFDGASFSAALATAPSKGWSNGAWTDGKRVYLADNSTLRAFSFDGQSLSEVGSLSIKGVNRLWGHGQLLYAGGEAGVTAVAIGASTLASIGLAPTADKVREVWSDGVHIFAAASEAGLYAYRIIGAAFVQVDRVDTNGSALGVVGDGTYIYVGDTNEVIAYGGFACRSLAGGG